MFWYSPLLLRSGFIDYCNTRDLGCWFIEKYKGVAQALFLVSKTKAGMFVLLLWDHWSCSRICFRKYTLFRNCRRTLGGGGKLYCLFSKLRYFLFSFLLYFNFHLPPINSKSFTKKCHGAMQSFFCGLLIYCAFFSWDKRYGVLRTVSRTALLISIGSWSWKHPVAKHVEFVQSHDLVGFFCGSKKFCTKHHVDFLMCQWVPCPSMSGTLAPIVINCIEGAVFCSAWLI